MYDVALVALPGGGATELLVHSEFNETDAAFAADGRFFAYASDESGRYEIYVRPFPNVEDGLWQVSRDGGAQPLRSRDGRELFYASPDGKLMGLSVRTDDDFTYGNPEIVVAKPHAELRASVVGYDISPDGRRFLMLEDIESSTTELFVVLN